MENSSSPEPSQERREWSASASPSMTAGVSCLPLACISRVPRVLRKVNEEAYTPQLVSIGPYHHGMERLKPMEKHKKRYQLDLLQRWPKLKNEHLLPNLKELEKPARGCYEDLVNYDSAEFVKMMLLDGCFIIELLFKYWYDEPGVQRSDQLFRSHSMIPALWFDMILLENQLPFFILARIFNLFTSSELNHEGPSFSELVLNFFSCESYLSIAQETPREKVNQEEPSHFLDLVRDFCLPFEDARRKILTEMAMDFIIIAMEMKGEGYDKSIPSAVELHKAGVKFTKVKVYRNLFMAMKFSSKGEFEIPLLIIHDYTEVLFRNLLAFEQCFETPKEQYITLYMHLMDSLINSPNDVAVLRRFGVIDNLAIEDERVSDIFNNISKGTVIFKDTAFYRAVACEVNKYYNKPWNLFKAMLFREYFYSPWASASSVAVIIVVICTIVQTFGLFFV